ncbi:MAG: transcription termination/antitermination protein NusG [Candidatus Scalindua sp.]
MKAWYAVKVIYRQEIETAARLNRLFESYCPEIPIDKRKIKRRKSDSQTEALFPSYIFVRMGEGIDDFCTVRYTPGVLRMVRLTLRDNFLYPTQVPDLIIENLKKLEDKWGIHAVKHDYHKGDSVIIKDGPFEGLQRLIEATAEDRVVILLDILGKEVPVSFGYTEVEPA